MAFHSGYERGFRGVLDWLGVPSKGLRGHDRDTMRATIRMLYIRASGVKGVLYGFQGFVQGFCGVPYGL